MTEQNYPLVIVEQPRPNYRILIFATFGLLLLAIGWFNTSWFDTQPNILITGIAPTYTEGEPINFSLIWSDGDVVKQVRFEIPKANVHKIWHTNATRGERKISLSTVAWLPTQYTYKITVITQNNKNYGLSGQFYLDKRDIVQPSSQIIGIESNYNVGSEVTYTLQAVDNRTLQKAIFTVLDTPIEQSWDVNTQQIAFQASFSTKSWEANRYYHYIFTVIDDVGNQFDRTGKFWLIEVDSIPPEAQLSGIKSSYVIGDKVDYQLKISDNEALKKITFKVNSDRVSQIWHTNQTSSEQQSSFSTEHWQAGEYEYQLTVLDHIENTKLITGKFTLQAPKPLAENNPSFVGRLVGIEQNYQVGDNISYSLENYHQTPTKSLLFEVEPDMKQTTWREDEIMPVMSNTFSTSNWQQGVYTYFITAIGEDKQILQRQQGTFALTQPAQPFEANAVSLLQICQQHFAARRYTVGKQGTALDCYRQVLELDASNMEAKKGLEAIEAKYQAFVENALKRQRWESAQLYLSRLAEVNPQLPAIKELQTRLDKLKAQQKREKAQQKSDKPKPAPPEKQVTTKLQSTCPHCDCEELLTKLSIGVEPLTHEEQAYQRAHCQ